MILQLKQAQQMAGVSETNILTRADHGSLDIWDSLVNDMLIASAKSVPVDGPAHHNTPVPANPLPIEDTIIALPSNGNMGNAHRDLELANRIFGRPPPESDTGHCCREKFPIFPCNSCFTT